MILVGLGRLELPTSPLSGVRSNHLSYRPVAIHITGGAGRDRTGDLLNANQALSQLSYSPLNPTEARSREPDDSTGSRIRSYFPRPIGRGTGIPDPNPEEPENESGEQDDVAWTGTAATYSTPLRAPFGDSGHVLS